MGRNENRGGVCSPGFPGPSRRRDLRGATLAQTSLNSQITEVNLRFLLAVFQDQSQEGLGAYDRHFDKDEMS